MDKGVGKGYASQNVTHFISHMFVGLGLKRGGADLSQQVRN